MTAIFLFLTLAVTVEGLVEYGKTLLKGDRNSKLLQIGALAVAVALCVLSGADVYAALGVTFSLPYVGCVLSGVFASGGANYENDILKKFQNAGVKAE